MSLLIGRGHIRASKGTFQIFLCLMVLWQIDILVEFCTLVFISSQIWKGCKWVRRSRIHLGLNLNRKKFYWRVTGGTLLGQKHKSAIWDRTPPHLHIKPSLYVCRRVQGSQIFKTELNYLDSFKSYCMYSNLQMAASIEASMFIMFNMHVHTCVHACMHVHVYLHGAFHTLTPIHTPIYPPYLPPRGVTPQIS